MTNDIVKIKASDYGLEESKAKEIESLFTPMLRKMSELESEYNDILKEEISPETCQRAKDLRSSYVKIRRGTEEIHRKAKQFYLNGGRFVDGWKNAQLFASGEKEDTLKKIEKHYEILEAEKKEKLREEREKLISPYMEEVNSFSLGEMTEEVWKKFYAGAKLEYETRIAAERKAEEERIAKEKAEAEERERQRLENIRLKKEIEEREIEQSRLKSERKEIALKFLKQSGFHTSMGGMTNNKGDHFIGENHYAEFDTDKELEDFQNRIKKEAEFAKEREKAEKERKALEEKARKEAEEREKLQAAIRAKEIAVEKAKINQIKAQKAADRKAKLAPDKEKLLAFGQALNDVPRPEIKAIEAAEIMANINGLLVKLNNYIIEKAETLTK